MTPKEMRERFEQWVAAMEPNYAADNLRLLPSGSYRVFNVAMWWKAWQAALASHAPSEDTKCSNCGHDTNDVMTECSQWGHSVPKSLNRNDTIEYWMTRATTAELKLQEFAKVLYEISASSAAEVGGSMADQLNEPERAFDAIASPDPGPTVEIEHDH